MFVKVEMLVKLEMFRVLQYVFNDIKVWVRSLFELVFFNYILILVSQFVNV